MGNRPQPTNTPSDRPTQAQSWAKRSPFRLLKVRSQIDDLIKLRKRMLANLIALDNRKPSFKLQPVSL
jgi:acyl-CoA reductase-like NAD-dependent aldehyde dehydrogenase